MKSLTSNINSAMGYFGVHIKYRCVFTYTMKKWWVCKSLVAITSMVIATGAYNFCNSIRTIMEEACQIQTKYVYGIRTYRPVCNPGAFYAGLQEKELKIVYNITQPDGGIQPMNENLQFVQESMKDRKKAME